MTNLGDGGTVLLGENKVVFDRLGPLGEQLHGRRSGDIVALSAPSQACQRERWYGDCSRSAESRSRMRLVMSMVNPGQPREQIGHERRGRHHLLEIVEHQEVLLDAQGSFEPIDEGLVPHLGDTKDVRDGGVTKSGSVIGASSTKLTPSGKSVCGRSRHAQRQTGLAHATGTGEGQERNILTQKQLAHCLEFALPPDQRGAWQRQSGGVAGREGGGPPPPGRVVLRNGDDSVARQSGPAFVALCGAVNFSWFARRSGWPRASAAGCSSPRCLRPGRAPGQRTPIPSRPRVPNSARAGS